jgi:hypothetical protein
VPKALNFKEFHLSTKAGPNGQALASCYQDFYALPDSLRESIKIIGGKKLSMILTGLENQEVQSILGKVFNTTPGEHIRKLVCFPDLEGKTRTVAILDY